MSKSDPTPANSVKFEYVYVANQRCECGGRFKVVSQELLGVSGGGPVDRVNAVCQACEEAVSFNFDISSFFGKFDEYDRFDHTEGLFREAMEHVRSGKWAEAEAALKRAVNPDEGEPAFAWAHYHLGMVLLMQNRPQEALSHLQRAAEIQPLEPDIEDGLGRAYQAAGQEQEAAKHFAARDAMQELYGKAEGT
jgi:tetratricopeptide (TPR) repeat protein